MQLRFLIILLSFFALPSLGQSIQGTIIDKASGSPLPRANVVVRGTAIGTSCDTLGRFTLDLPAGSYTLDFSYLGFYTQAFKNLVISDSINRPLRIDVALEPAEEYLKAVTVTAGKFDQALEEVTVSLDIISTRLIENKNTYLVQNVLEQYSGINITDDQANIRGGSGWSYGAGTRVQVLLDGLPMIDGGSGQVQWKSIPTELVEQIEVIKGASSALYGSSALNGVINVRTKPASDSLITELTLFSGVYGNPPRSELKWWSGPQTFSGLNWRTSWSDGADGITLGGHALRDDGFEYNVEDHRMRLEGGWNHRAEGSQWEYGLNANINYRKSGDALIWNSEEEGYIPLDSLSTVTEANFVYLDPYAIWRGNRWVHQLKGRFLANNNISRSETNNYDNAFQTYYTEYQGQYFLDESFALTGGLVNSWSLVDAELFQGEHDSYNLAGYLQLDKKYGKLNFSLGGRYEYFRLNETTYSRPVLRSGINYALSKATFFRASFGQGYRFPTMAEKFTSANVGAIWIYPNEDLEPESGWSAEIGFKQGFKIGAWKGFIDGAAFWMRYDNMMEFTFARWAENNDINQFFGLGFKSVNIGTSDIKGFEISSAMEYSIGKHRWQLMGGYTFMNPTIANPDEVFTTAIPIGTLWPDSLTYANISSDPSGILKYRYQHLLKFDLQYNYQKWSAGASIRHNDFMQNVDLIFVSDLFNSQVPGIADSRDRLNRGDVLWDFRVGYSLNPNFQIRFLVQNAFNREILVRPAKLGPPAQFTLQIQTRF